MTRQAQLLLLLTLGLMAASALLLNRLKSAQKLGVPGVQVVARPIYDEKGALAATNAVFLPDRVLDFESRDIAIARIELDWLPKDTTYGRRLYRAPDGTELLLVAVLMGTDRTSIHKPQQCLAGQGFGIEKQEPQVVPIRSPHPYDLPVLRMTSGREVATPGGGKLRQRALYAYWFVADREITADHNQRMWWMSRDLLRSGILQRWAYIGCFGVCLPGQEDALWARMKEFLGAAVPQFQRTTLPPSSTPLSLAPQAPPPWMRAGFAPSPRGLGAAAISLYPQDGLR
jgi:hypothetical protein